MRARSDGELRELLRRRPDLARPAPADLTSLAARASTRASVLRALDSLDRAHLQVLEAAALQSGPIDEGLLAQHLGTDPADPADHSGPHTTSAGGRTAAAALLDDLWQTALLWRSGEGLHVTRAVAEARDVGAEGRPRPSCGGPPRLLSPSRIGSTSCSSRRPHPRVPSSTGWRGGRRWPCYHRRGRPARWPRVRAGW